MVCTITTRRETMGTEPLALSLAALAAATGAQP